MISGLLLYLCVYSSILFILNMVNMVNLFGYHLYEPLVDGAVVAVNKNILIFAYNQWFPPKNIFCFIYFVKYICFVLAKTMGSLRLADTILMFSESLDKNIEELKQNQQSAIDELQLENERKFNVLGEDLQKTIKVLRENLSKAEDEIVKFC